jgi:hypothetical protein
VFSEKTLALFAPPSGSLKDAGFEENSKFCPFPLSLLKVYPFSLWHHAQQNLVFSEKTLALFAPPSGSLKDAGFEENSKFCPFFAQQTKATRLLKTTLP